MKIDCKLSVSTRVDFGKLRFTKKSATSSGLYTYLHRCTQVMADLSLFCFFCIKSHLLLHILQKFTLAFL